MKCQACDKNLSDQESTRKNDTTGEFVDLCNECNGAVNEILTIVELDKDSE